MSLEEYYFVRGNLVRVLSFDAAKTKMVKYEEKGDYATAIFTWDTVPDHFKNDLFQLWGVVLGEDFSGMRGDEIKGLLVNMGLFGPLYWPLCDGYKIMLSTNETLLRVSSMTPEMFKRYAIPLSMFLHMPAENEIFMRAVTQIYERNDDKGCNDPNCENCVEWRKAKECLNNALKAAEAFHPKSPEELYATKRGLH